MINESWEYYKEVYKDMISLAQYQSAASKTAMYKHNHKILYPALGLAGEAGEVANKVKKMLRDGKFDREDVAAEVGDCLWYIAALCRDLHFDMTDLAQRNLTKLNSRMERGTIQGSGDKR